MDNFYSPYEKELKKIIKGMLQNGLSKNDILNLYLINLKEVLEEAGFTVIAEQPEDMTDGT